MHLEYLTLKSSRAAVELSMTSEVGSTVVKMVTQVVHPYQVFTDSGVNVAETGFLVWVYCQGEVGPHVPDDSIGSVYCEQRCRASVTMGPSQFERLQNAVLMGATFEVYMTVDAGKKPDGPETILYGKEFGKLSVLDVSFTAEPPQRPAVVERQAGN